MVRSTIAKLYSTVMEQKVKPWAESQNKQPLGQQRSKHTTKESSYIKSNYGTKSTTRKNALFFLC